MEFSVIDRIILQPGAIPLSTDGGNIQRNTMISLGWLMQAVLGTSISLDGLACTPTSPASLAVQIAPGMITTLETVDLTQFGALPLGTDNVAPLVKMGILPVYDPATMLFTLAVPNTTGQSINYLIQCSFEETDGLPLQLPFFNAANPNQSFLGPNGSGAAVNTARFQKVQLQLKGGVPATDGTQTTPVVDAGWTGLWIITVRYGDVAIDGSRIAMYPGAPFLTNKLPQLQALAGGGPYAPINSPAFSGTPTAPNATASDYTTKLATTKWATDAINAKPHGNAVIVATGNWTVPAGVTSVEVTATGGGAGGAGTNGTVAGGGGGAGGTVINLVSVTPGQIIPCTIGVGGTGGAAAAANFGGNGGATSFGAFVSASGAAGGGINNGGQPGGGSGGLVLTGGYGMDGYTGPLTFAGAGGPSYWGGGGRQSTTPGPADAIAYGAGGGGRWGPNAGVGGRGAAGIIFLRW